MNPRPSSYEPDGLPSTEFCLFVFLSQFKYIKLKDEFDFERTTLKNFKIIPLVIVTVLILAVPMGLFFYLLASNGLNPLDIQSFVPKETELSPLDMESESTIAKIKSLRADSLKNLVWAFGSILGVFIAVVGVVNSVYRTEQKDKEIEQTRRIADSDLYSSAVEKLGSQEPEIQIGGLYELEFLAKLDLKNNETDDTLPIAIKQTIANFIRLKSRIDDSVKRSAIETAAIVLSKTFSEVPNSEKEISSEIDLLNLREAKFLKYKFPNEMSFKNFDLTDATFQSCNLIGAEFDGSNLYNGNFKSCELQRSSFREADLTDCQIMHDCKLDDRIIWGSNTPNIISEDIDVDDAKDMEPTKKNSKILDKYEPLVREYDKDASKVIIQNIIKYCGIALTLRDTSLVACSDEREKERIATMYGIKKLGASSEAANKAVEDICIQMNTRRFKDRVTFYYLMAKNLNKLDIFE